MRIRGYVVCSRENGPLALVDDPCVPPPNILWSHTFATVFKTRQAARGAITRTKKAAAKLGYDRHPAWQNHYVKELRG